MDKFIKYNELLKLTPKKNIPLLNLPENEIIAIVGKDFYNEISSKKIS